MEKEFVGLIGVVLGGVLVTAKDWWLHYRKNKKDVSYLCIRVSCMLENFSSSCVEVVHDDGLFQGQYDTDGCRHMQIKPPIFDLENMEVEWRSLPTSLMYEVLNFPNKIELGKSKVSSVFEYVAGPPDYEEGIEERQYQYALLGIEALEMSSKLREFGKLPARDTLEWDPFSSLNDKKKEIESLIKQREDEHLARLKKVG